ncbi:MAG: fibronectin type III domain-containing protein [Ignavibacteria bacterium]|nr:fibronectin type III domain-containing protein [Ignavibacteria bacterium]
MNNNSFEEKPVNLSAVQNGDSIKVNWNANSSQEIKFTTVMYKSVSNNSISRESITDTNSLKLTDLTYGRRYKIWATYTDTSGNPGNSSDTLELLYRSFTQNNPPCFISDPDSILYFIESESKSYFLNAFDADGNSISFHALDNPLGLEVGGNTLKWEPHIAQRGFYTFKIIASDGISADTISTKCHSKKAQRNRDQYRFQFSKSF